MTTWGLSKRTKMARTDGEVPTSNAVVAYKCQDINTPHHLGKQMSRDTVLPLQIVQSESRLAFHNQNLNGNLLQTKVA